MIYEQFAAIVLDNSLLIGLLGLVTGMVPGILLFIIEREKLKQARERVASEREAVGRLENLVTELQNTLIAVKDRTLYERNPDPVEGAINDDSSAIVPPEPVPAEPLPTPGASGAQVPLPTSTSGKFVIWFGLTPDQAPRYVLLTWEAGGSSFRVRDYIGGMMLHPQGIAAPNETNFYPLATAITFGEIWRGATCHMKVRGQLDQRVNNFSWWNIQLTILTEGHEAGRQLAPTVKDHPQTRGVLLMLSSDQQPPPRTEVRWHAEQSAKGEITYLATTRILTDLVSDKSLVAFYGDASLFNQVLGYGIFMDFIRTTTPEGRALLQEHPHYQQYGMPEQVLGLIKMRDFKELPAGTCLDSFNATIDGNGVSSGRPLSLVNIPEGASRAQVYFKTSAQ